jgi:cytochrome P450
VVQIKSLLIIKLFQGHDTTSSGMGWALWCIAHHADVQQKIFDELDAIFGNQFHFIPLVSYMFASRRIGSIGDC